MRRRIVLIFLALLPHAEAGSVKDVTYFGFGAEGPPSIENPDARAGLASILNGEDWNYGLPLKLFRKIFVEDGHYQPDDFWNVMGSLPSPKWRNTHGLPLPLSDSVFRRQGREVVNLNCFSCHSGVVAGQVVAGLGSTHIDNASFREASRNLISQWDSPIRKFFLQFLLDSEEMDLLGGFVTQQRTIVLPSVKAVTRGEIYGPFVVWQHIARMIDPEQGMETYPEDEEGPLEKYLHRPLPPVDPSPWWNLKYKQRDFWTQDVTIASLPTYALNLMDPHGSNSETFPARMERTRKQLAFAYQTVAPPFPKRAAINKDLAATGRAFFHGEKTLEDGTSLACFSCHGKYSEVGEVVSYPNHSRIDLETVKTDPAYAALLHDVFKPLYDHFAKSKFISPGSSDAKWPNSRGYTAPPLKGIWASAPYFHNGSVPTVTAVLKSTSRPKFWRKNIDPFAYDYAKLGLTYFDVEDVQMKKIQHEAKYSNDPFSQQSLLLRQVMNTTLYGRTNTGHTFGDRMNDNERAAVVEYLKML